MREFAAIAMAPSLERGSTTLDIFSAPSLCSHVSMTGTRPFCSALAAVEPMCVPRQRTGTCVRTYTADNFENGRG